MNKKTNETLNHFHEIDTKYISCPISLIYINIRSLRLNFTTFLTNINRIINKIKIIVLVETNISDNENIFYNIHGFNSVFLNRDGKGGGIAVYVKENIEFSKLSTKTKSFELIQLNINTSSEPLSLLSVYRPPNLKIPEFITELDTVVNNIKKKQEIVIVGDMNIDIKTDNITTTTYLDMILSNGMQSMVKESTRVDVNKNTSTCIDHVFIKNNQANSHANATIIRTTISDHYSIFCCIQKEQKNQGSETRITQGPQYNNSKVNKSIRETNWNEVINQIPNTESLYNKIFKKFCEIYKTSNKETKPSKKRSNNPWISEELVKYCDTRDKLHRKWRNNKNNKIFESEYKKFRNSLNKKIHNAKNMYYKNKFLDNKNDMRATWQIINEIIGKKTSNLDETVIKNFKNDNINVIINNFSTNFNDNVKKIIHDCNIKTSNNIETTLQNSMYLSYTNEEEIYNILTTLNSKKGAGADCIRPRDLKNNVNILTPILTKLINSSLENAVVPKQLKTSIIRPIYKGGSKSDYNNYRPIAILSVIEKVLEEVIARRLNEYLQKYNIINKNQFGFQKGKNINKLLGNFSNHINKCLSQHMHCLVLYIDFSKAFDTLSHSKLIQMLERVGIRGNTLNWFKNYLECRTYQVKINNNFSDEISSEYGVPQGSKLGPILYIIYANDMINALQASTTFAYADDTAIIVADKNMCNATRTLQNQFDIATKWCHDNGLLINATKTKVMHIKPPHLNNTSIQIKFHDRECLHNKNSTNDTCNTYIEVVNSYKYLGVYIDSSFKWNLHVENIQKKLRKSAYALYHLSNCATYNVLRQAYFSLSESYIRHGITAWGSATYCRTLQNTQNQLLKILWKNQRLSSETTRYITNNVNNTIVAQNNQHNNNTNSNIHNNNYQNSSCSNNINNNSSQIIITNNNIHNNIVVNNTHQQQRSNQNNINHNRVANNRNVNNRTTNETGIVNTTKTNNLAKDVNVLNVKSLYYTTLINEFFNDTRFLKPIDHVHNTRRRAEGRFKVERFRNEYGRNTLAVTLPTIFNTIPTQTLNLKNKYTRNKIIKKHYISLQ